MAVIVKKVPKREDPGKIIKVPKQKVSTTSVPSVGVSNSSKHRIWLMIFVLVAIVAVAFLILYPYISQRETVAGQAIRGVYSCIGEVDFNSHVCINDDMGLIANVPISLVKNCTTRFKCEYVCNEGFIFDVQTNSCVLIESEIRFDSEVIAKSGTYENNFETLEAKTGVISKEALIGNKIVEINEQRDIVVPEFDREYVSSMDNLVEVNANGLEKQYSNGDSNPKEEALHTLLDEIVSNLQNNSLTKKKQISSIARALREYYSSIEAVDNDN